MFLTIASLVVIVGGMYLTLFSILSAGAVADENAEQLYEILCNPVA